MLGGVATILDVEDLIRAKDSELSQLDAAQAKFLPTWKGTDPTAASAWLADYQALTARYQGARKNAQVSIGIADVTPIPDSTFTDPLDYQALLSAIQVNPGVVSPGDLQDLWNRLSSAQNAPIAESPVPQPSATDWDLSAYQAADSTVKATEAGAKAAVGAAEKAGKALDNAIPLWAKVTLVGGAVAAGALAVKAYLPSLPHRKEA